MRIRSIRPEFWTSEDIASLDWDARLIFIGLWSYVDDNGVGRDVEKLILADLFPLEDDPRDTLARVSRALDALAARSLIARYTVDGKPYLHIATWATHQKIDRPGKDRYPLPTSEDAEARESVARVSREVRDTPSTGEGEKGRRGEVTTAPRERGRRIPDDFEVTDDMRAWAEREGFGHLDLEQVTVEFVDYWASESGAKAVKLDWVGTWRNRVRTVAQRTPANVRPIRPADPHAGEVRWVLPRPNGMWIEYDPDAVWYGCKTQWLPAGERPA